MPFYRIPEWVEEEMVLFGHRARAARHGVGLSQQRLADHIAMSQAAISRAERGVAPHMTLERLIRISAALGPWFVLGGCPHDHHCQYGPRRDYPIFGTATRPWVTRLRD